VCGFRRSLLPALFISSPHLEGKTGLGQIISAHKALVFPALCSGFAVDPALARGPRDVFCPRDRDSYLLSDGLPASRLLPTPRSRQVHDFQIGSTCHSDRYPGFRLRRPWVVLGIGRNDDEDVRSVDDVSITLCARLALVHDIKVHDGLCVPRRASSHIMGRMTVNLPATELADNPMRDVIGARAAAMMEDERTIMAESNKRQGAAKIPSLLWRQ
jgi:hypothetical protein